MTTPEWITSQRAARYAEARDRFEQATAALRAAEQAAAQIMRDADREYAAAEADLRTFEESPGIPRAEYRGAWR